MIGDLRKRRISLINERKEKKQTRFDLNSQLSGLLSLGAKSGVLLSATGSLVKNRKKDTAPSLI